MQLCARHGRQARQEVILSLALLSALSNVTRPTTKFNLHLLRVLLLIVVVAKDLQQLFCSRDPILELAKVQGQRVASLQKGPHSGGVQ